MKPGDVNRASCVHCAPHDKEGKKAKFQHPNILMRRKEQAVLALEFTKTMSCIFTAEYGHPAIWQHQPP